MSSTTIKHLKIIDFHLAFFGRLKRADLVMHCGIGVATASRLLAQYRDQFQDNFRYDSNQKAYLTDEGFTPAFSHEAEDALNYLAYKKVELFIGEEREPYLTRLLTISSTLSVSTVREVTTALTLSRPIILDYYSASSERKERLVQPLAVFEAAGAWYFRAYDFGESGFRVFRFSRILSARRAEPTGIKPPLDTEWQEQVVVTLMPHPKHPKPEALKLDLGLVDKPVLNITTRKALVGFLLKALYVDTSSNAVLSPFEYQLYLANRHELQALSSMKLAPGFSYNLNQGEG